MRSFAQVTASLLLICIPLISTGESRANSSMQAQQGEASYYADSLDGNKTASGEPYDKDAYTAAHRTLPFGTKVKVTHLGTGKSVECCH